MDESQEEIRKEPSTTNVQVFYQDLNTSIEYVSTIVYNLYFFIKIFLKPIQNNVKI